MIKIKSIAPFALIALALAAGTSLSAQDRMRAGLWETTVTSGEKSTVRTSCITPELAAASNQSVQVVRASMEKAVAGSCKVTVKDFTAADNVITTQVVCGAISYVNTTTYKGDTIETAIVNVNAGVTKKTLNVSRRVGACK